MTRIIFTCFVLISWALPALSAPYCTALTSPDTVPKAHIKRAPFLSDTVSGWILGQDQLKNAFEVTDEVRLLWQAISHEFAERGADLVVLSAPPRPLFVPEEDLRRMGHDLGHIRDTLGAAYTNYISGLNAEGIPAPDLSSLARSDARGEYYFLRDTHWTPRGAAASVAALHAAATDEDTPQGPEFLRHFEEPGSLSKVVAEICGTHPAPERVSAPDYHTRGGADALFGDAEGRTRIALVGTSFSNRYQHDAYQVGDAIAHYFDADVSNYALAGGGPTGAMIAFIESGALDAGAYGHVIWESPYTVPLVDTDSLRHVLGALTAHRVQDAVPGQTAPVSDVWTSVPLAFDAAEFVSLSVQTPGTTAGRLVVEMIADDGERHRIRLFKSDRLPPDLRTETWTLALDGLSSARIARVKLRLMGVDTPQPASVHMLR
ncbi:MAG: hypothetical protein AAF218_04805 [Pseudomonadota bacterium]